MHKSLTPRFNITLIVVWLLVLAVALVMAWQQSISLVCFTLSLGVIAGLLQARALSVTPDRFRSAATTTDVRRALVSTFPGKLSIFLLWATGAVALVWAIVANPSNPIFIWLAGYASFSVARESCALPGVLRLSQLT
ncbi:MAG TPA: hypothetical protein VK629_13080 [Steroidobacteraceae bacterium]|nr:hypothetical protein [Steroidobacteraceae bacterium]